MAAKRIRQHGAVNLDVQINVGGSRVSAGGGEPVPEELTREELAAQTGEELPDREAMSLIDANIAAPVNAAVALNVLSDDSTAFANAEQTADITQT